MTKHITVALNAEEEAYLAGVAARAGTTLEGALAEVIQEGIDHQAWLDEIVEEGLDDIRNGRTLSHEEVVEQGRQLREELLRKKAG